MIESYFNTINHVLNGSMALYMTWLCFQAGWTITTWHALLLTIGYQLLMAEGIMALYSANSWSYFHSKDTKRLVHLIVLVGATILILVGISLKIANVSSEKHFKSIHSITGLVSMVFLVLGMLQGFAAYFAKELKVYIKPVYTKLLHILMATFCFVTVVEHKMATNKFVTVDTEYGQVKGVKKVTILGTNYINFQGIPYMKATTGKLRFRDAQAPEKWNEPLDVTEEGSCFPIFDFMTKKFDGTESGGVINVYTKNVNPDKVYPVMVWIHGGGYNAGSSKTDLYGPDFLLQKDVIVVSFNYRLAAFGFLSLDDPELNIPGNAGLKDQTFALKWVQKNIANFGGDPDNVTIFGESAGGGSVHSHMISNISKGLFHKAIPMSGVTFNKTWSLIPRRNWAHRLAEYLGYNGLAIDKDVLEFLENVDAFKIVEGCGKMLTDDEQYGEHLLIAFGPVVEPYVTENTFFDKDVVLMARDAWSKDINVMIGGSSYEGLMMAFSLNVLNVSKPVDVLRNSNYFTPSYELGLNVNDENCTKYGKILKQLYYGCTQPSKTNTEGALTHCTDLYFWHGIQRAVLSRISAGGSGKTYLYRFDAQTDYNYCKKWSKSEDFNGASHGDDLSYLFYIIYQELPAEDSKAFELIKKMVAIYTSFAITGNPNTSEITNMEWKPETSLSLPLSCLNITADEIKQIPLPEYERLAVWDDIYNQENIELF
ncbi:unnamed protein product [Diamesa serratosioi]